MNLFAFCLSVRGFVSPAIGEPLAFDAFNGDEMTSTVIAAERFSASTTIRSAFLLTLSPTVNCHDIFGLPLDDTERVGLQRNAQWH